MALDEWLPAIEAIRAEGAIVLIKWDGGRTRAVCTVTIGRAGDFWRRDGNDVEAILRHVIAEYRDAFPPVEGSPR